MAEVWFFCIKAKEQNLLMKKEDCDLKTAFASFYGGT